LALKWAVTEKFNDYLYGNTFSVMTDNNPLTYVLTTAKLDATGHRWLSALAMYDFNLVYKTGKTNTDADSMSRHLDNQTANLNIESIKAICNCMHQQPLYDTVAMSTIDLMEATETEGHPIAQIDIREIRKQQRQDPVISFWLTAVKDRKLPVSNKFSHDRENRAFEKAFGS